jgi:hypothetical protein
MVDTLRYPKASHGALVAIVSKFMDGAALCMWYRSCLCPGQIQQPSRIRLGHINYIIIAKLKLRVISRLHTGKFCCQLRCCRASMHLLSTLRKVYMFNAAHELSCPKAEVRNASQCNDCSIQNGRLAC